MWLVLGANGQLGSCLTNLLTTTGTEFLAPSRQQLDITNAKKVNDYFESSNFSMVVNCAAWTAVDDAEEHIAEALRVNYEGPKNLAYASINTHARLIHISTDYVFAGDGTEPYEVDTPTNPINAYGRTKQMGESTILALGSGQFTVVRTAWLYSQYGKNFAKTMVARAVQGLPVRVVDDQFGQPTSAHDLSSLIIQIAKASNPPSIVHGTNSGIATWYEFARQIYTLVGADVELVTPVASSEFPTRALRPTYSVLGHQAFRKNGLSEMRNWKLALQSEIGAIKESLLKELQ